MIRHVGIVYWMNREPSQLQTVSRILSSVASSQGICSEFADLPSGGWEQGISEPTRRLPSIFVAPAVQIKSSKHHTSKQRLLECSGFQGKMNTMVIFLGVIFHPNSQAWFGKFFSVIGFLYNPEESEESTGFIRLPQHKMFKKPWSRVLGLIGFGWGSALHSTRLETRAEFYIEQGTSPVRVK